jgi:chromosome segregation ATPase
VERIREIIVGRHLEKLEGRVSHLESAHAAPGAPAAPAFSDASIFEDRLLRTEARVEALQDHVHRIEGLREETEQIAAMHRKEAQRLASQIHEIARERAEASVQPAVERLERKLGAWLTDWQKSLQARLDSRDRDLTEKIRAEVGEMKAGIESRFRDIEAKVPADVEDRFNRIATAARALAESAAEFSSPITPRP